MVELTFLNEPTALVDQVQFSEPEPIEGMWYRYEDRPGYHAGAPATVTLRMLRVIRKTPRGVMLDDWGFEHFVRDEGRKRFAYPTIELARESFLKRKQWQIGYARRQFDHVSAVLAATEKHFA